MTGTITPGPWTAEAPLSPGASIDIVAREPEHGCRVEVAWANGRREERDANARAIAALPDLLRTLEHIVERANRPIKAGSTDVQTCAVPAALIEEARAALRQAREG